MNFFSISRIAAQGKSIFSRCANSQNKSPSISFLLHERSQLCIGNLPVWLTTHPHALTRHLCMGIRIYAPLLENRVIEPSRETWMSNTVSTIGRPYRAPQIAASSEVLLGPKCRGTYLHTSTRPQSERAESGYPKMTGLHYFRGQRRVLSLHLGLLSPSACESLEAKITCYRRRGTLNLYVRRQTKQQQATPELPLRRIFLVDSYHTITPPTSPPPNNSRCSTKQRSKLPASIREFLQDGLWNVVSHDLRIQIDPLERLPTVAVDHRFIAKFAD